jgi:hypothetical protein
MGLPEPSDRLAAAIRSMEQTVGALDVPDGEPMSDALLTALAQDSPDEDPLDGLVRRVLLAMLEERRTRAPATLAHEARPGAEDGPVVTTRGTVLVGADRRTADSAT